MSPFAFFISGLLLIVSMIIFYAILAFNKANIRIKDIWFILLQFAICAFCIYLMFAHGTLYLIVTLSITFIMSLILATDKSSGKSFDFSGFIAVLVMVVGLAFFVIPFASFAVYFKLDESSKRNTDNP